MRLVDWAESELEKNGCDSCRTGNVDRAIVRSFSGFWLAGGKRLVKRGRHPGRLISAGQEGRVAQFSLAEEHSHQFAVE